ncbi:MAG TPA: hypothetical protein VFA50_05885 [Stellaceae bacterium]|nr:hypothetical protein [Stellaceae bacterium]
MKWLDQAEPRLEEALSDPVVRAVMARDGVAPEEVRSLVQRMSELRHDVETRQEAA